MAETLFALIDSADADGIHRFRYADYLEQYLPKDRQGILRDIMEHEMSPAQFVGARIRRGMAWANQFEASVQRGSDGHWEGCINLARALGLRGIEPAKELATLRTLLVDIRTWLAETPTERRALEPGTNSSARATAYLISSSLRWAASAAVFFPPFCVPKPCSRATPTSPSRPSTNSTPLR